MKRYCRVARKPTLTSMVEGFLRACMDYKTTNEIALAVSSAQHRTRITLMHLRQHKVVDKVDDSDGTEYWFPLPAVYDNRLWVQKERAVEGKARHRKSTYTSPHQP